jgi:hypothetical protein
MPASQLPSYVDDVVEYAIACMQIFSRVSRTTTHPVITNCGDCLANHAEIIPMTIIKEEQGND